MTRSVLQNTDDENPHSSANCSIYYANNTNSTFPQYLANESFKEYNQSINQYSVLLFQSTCKKKNTKRS